MSDAYVIWLEFDCPLCGTELDHQVDGIDVDGDKVLTLHCDDCRQEWTPSTTYHTVSQEDLAAIKAILDARYLVSDTEPLSHHYDLPLR